MRRRLEKVYREHRQGLFSFALSITGSREMAEDAVHVAFERLWRTRRKPKGDAVAYVFAAVRNAAVDQVRRRRELPPITAPIYDESAADPHQAIVEAERQDRIRAGVEALPAHEREVVVMKVYGGLTFKQIAEVLGEPLPTVASRYRRTLATLKTVLEDDRP